MALYVPAFVTRKNIYKTETNKRRAELCFKDIFSIVTGTFPRFFLVPMSGRQCISLILVRCLGLSAAAGYCGLGAWAHHRFIKSHSLGQIDLKQSIPEEVTINL